MALFSVLCYAVAAGFLGATISRILVGDVVSRRQYDNAVDVIHDVDEQLTDERSLSKKLAGERDAARRDLLKIERERATLATVLDKTREVRDSWIASYRDVNSRLDTLRRLAEVGNAEWRKVVKAVEEEAAEVASDRDRARMTINEIRRLTERLDDGKRSEAGGEVGAGIGADLLGRSGRHGRRGVDAPGPDVHGGDARPPVGDQA